MARTPPLLRDMFFNKNYVTLPWYFFFTNFKLIKSCINWEFGIIKGLAGEAEGMERSRNLPYVFLIDWESQGTEKKTIRVYKAYTRI